MTSRSGSSIAVLGGLSLLALSLRLVGLAEETLWLDEIYEATIAVQPVFEVIISTLRFDVHPPLHHLQLHFWSLAGQADWWLILNSVLWSVVAVGSLYATTRAVFGEKIAITAAVLLAVAPASVLFAQSLRPYSLFMALAIWSAWLHRRCLASGRGFIAVALLQLVILYSYALGAFMVSCLVFYGLLVAHRLRPEGSVVKRWVATQLTVAVLGLPSVLFVASHTVTHSSAPGPWHVANTIGYTLLGTEALRLPWLPIGGVLAVAAAVAAAAVLGKGREEAIGLVLTPILVGVLGSYGAQPFWTQRLLLFTLPFMTLALSITLWVGLRRFVAATRVRDRLAWTTSVGCAAILSTLTFLQIARHEESTDFRKVAAFLQERVQADDIVYAPRVAVFWGLAWYLDSPNWGSPLDFVDLAESERWQSLIDRLGPDWQRRLRLRPKGRLMRLAQIQMLVGKTESEWIADADRVWLVDVEWKREGPQQYPVDDLSEDEEVRFGQLTVRRLSRSQAGLQPQRE